jgi:hypothetical protein
MPITNPAAVAFSNQQIRPLADKLSQLYYQALVLLNTWNANGGAGILPPTTVTPTPSASGGTLAAGVKSYRVSALNARGETLVSNAFTATTTGSSGSVSVAWSAVAGATSFNIYGRTAGNELLIGTSAASPFVDTGSVTPAGAQPTTNTTGLIPNDSETVADGSATDGRMPITAAQAVAIVTRATDIKNLFEGSVAVSANDGTKAVLNTIAAVAVNPKG